MRKHFEERLEPQQLVPPACLWYHQVPAYCALPWEQFEWGSRQRVHGELWRVLLAMREYSQVSTQSLTLLKPEWLNSTWSSCSRSITKRRPNSKKEAKAALLKTTLFIKKAVVSHHLAKERFQCLDKLQIHLWPILKPKWKEKFLDKWTTTMKWVKTLEPSPLPRRPLRPLMPRRNGWEESEGDTAPRPALSPYPHL